MLREIEEGLEEYEIDREERRRVKAETAAMNAAIMRDIAEVKFLMELEELEESLRR